MRRSVIPVLLLAAAGLVVPSPAAAAGNTLTVNVGTAVRPVTHVAAGGLYAVDTGSKPPLEQMYPLRMNHLTQPPPGVQQLGNGATVPCCDGLQVAGKVTSAGAQQFWRLPDIYRDFPYKWVSWADWESKVRTMVNARLAATGTTNVDGYELWNEPDWTWNTGSAGTFNAGWTRTVKLIRSLDPVTPIVGPSISWYNHDYLVSFLTNARDTGTLPDVIVWHELDNDDYLNIGADVADYRAIEKSLGISPRPISINEYASPSQVDIPSVAVHFMATFERYGIRDAERAYWYEAGTLNGLLHDNAPTSSYWAYKWYGEMAGTIVQTVPGSWLEGVAAYDPTRRFVNVVFGGDSGNNTVKVNGLGALGSQVRATLVRSGTTGRTTNQSAPIAVSSATYQVSGGSISVPVAGMDAADAYQLLITPASGAATWQQRYEAENATVVNANRFSAGSASNGGYVGQIDGSANSRNQSFVDFVVNVPTARTYTMTIGYANATGATATQGLAYNGGAFQTISYPPTAAWGVFGSTVSTPVTLKAGYNVIRLAKGSPNFAGGTGYAELDYLNLA
ncbi:CBM35 domain-containing protein [Actinoplanes oblitus]|uniref:CBM35 domain-containing protein n=1 Tax=Actinoplanes oblitus TaxID=3040509 RepID=A0ABY8WDN1_9ACTN|nr:CBM35 domain-containing protein [Actinoplanes oblitus]WIM95163.1 CBM35 domain-containing protein [Actinoplanes oblitus]